MLILSLKFVYVPQIYSNILRCTFPKKSLHNPILKDKKREKNNSVTFKKAGSEYAYEIYINFVHFSTLNYVLSEA